MPIGIRNFYSIGGPKVVPPRSQWALKINRLLFLQAADPETHP